MQYLDIKGSGESITRDLSSTKSTNACVAFTSE